MTDLYNLCVIDTDAEVTGAPGAPLDVFCQEANKDYVIVTWKQPAVDGGSSILGYFVDRCIFLNLNFFFNGNRKRIHIKQIFWIRKSILKRYETI